MKWGFLGDVIDFLLIRPLMERNLDQMLRGLEYHLASGKVVTDSTLLPGQEMYEFESDPIINYDNWPTLPHAG